MRPVYSKTPDTRLAGLERRVRFLERREQLPNPHTDADLGGGGGLLFDGSTEILVATGTSVPGGGYVNATLAHQSNSVLCSGYGAAPTVGAEGLYCISAIFTCPTTLTANHWIQGTLLAGTFSAIDQVKQQVATGLLQAGCAMTVYLAAGDSFVANLQQNDTITVTFDTTVWLQRLIGP